MGNLSMELAWWIRERDLVRGRKEAGEPKPWSKDRVMRYTRFTNVRREDDRVTKWIAKNWRDENHEHQCLVPAMVLARFVNRIETLSAVGFPFEWDPQRAVRVINDRASQGITVWGNAYMITTCGVRMDKAVYVTEVANDVYERLHTLEECDCQGAHQWLMKTKGLGSFLAGQVVADLKNTPGFFLADAPDWITWAASGPGSRKGLNYYMGKPPDSPWSEGAWRRCAASAWEEVRPLLPEHLRNIHMQDFQNCFCEFSKYMRIKNGGRAKNRYPG